MLPTGTFDWGFQFSVYHLCCLYLVLRGLLSLFFERNNHVRLFYFLEQLSLKQVFLDLHLEVKWSFLKQLKQFVFRDRFKFDEISSTLSSEIYKIDIQFYESSSSVHFGCSPFHLCQLLFVNLTPSIIVSILLQ